MINEQVGSYRIVELLGSGAVGNAYRAEHIETGDQVAIKFLQSHALTSQEIQQRFVREVAICEKLNHPNIVGHFDCGIHEDGIYYAMELVDAGSIESVLKRSRCLPWREVVECAAQICAALQHAHNQGIIHRDLKPANLFLSEDGQVKIGDFGLARDQNKDRLTLDGQTVGTCKYMPPEQIMGEAELTGTVDIYALGCILFEMLTGEPPFIGHSIPDIFDQHLEAEPPKLENLVPGCPPALVSMINTMLAKSPGDRPENAAAVEVALLSILKNPEETPQTDDNGDDLELEENSNLNLTERLHQAQPIGASPIVNKAAIFAIALLVLIIIVIAIVVSQPN